MRRAGLLLLPLLLLGGAAPAREAETPLLVFREPDAATRREITDLFSTKDGLGASDPEKRGAARDRLREIGPWTVPLLAEAVHGRRRERSVRLRMNAVLALALVRDPRGLPALRGAAVEDDDVWVRHAATLSVGHFRRPEDLGMLRLMLEDRKLQYPRAAAPALAKLRRKEGAEVLVGFGAHLPPDRYDAAAIVLAAAVASPRAEPLPHLAHAEKIVQRAAATALALRPLPAARAGELLAFQRRPGRDPALGALVVHALGAIPGRPDEVRARLLDLARDRGDPHPQERIAALLELDGRVEDYGDLRNAYGKVRGRNDPLAGALIAALARTGHPDAVEPLLGLLRTGSDFLKTYAALALVERAVFGPKLADEPAVWAALKDAKLRPGWLPGLAELAGSLPYDSDPESRRRKAREFFRAAGDPRDLHLFDRTREERAWHHANRLLAEIFRLDDLAVQLDSGKERTPESPLPGGGGGGEESVRKAPSATPEEQDLFDFFRQEPYFGPEDLGEG